LRKVHVEPTNACSLDCETYVRHSRDGFEGFMERTAVQAVLDGLAQATSGEPGTVAFRDRVRRYGFPPCTDCGYDLTEADKEDCLGNPQPTYGDCLWARGIIRCA
jgi:hypothetical protein